MSYLMRNKENYFPVWSSFNFLFGSMSCKCVISFSLFSCDPDLTQTSTGLSLCIYGGLLKMVILPATVLLPKTDSVIFL